MSILRNPGYISPIKPTSETVPQQTSPAVFRSEEEIYALFKAEVLKVRSEPMFQSSPREYVLNWSHERGHSEEWLLPEDLVLSFFKRTCLGMVHEKQDLGYFKGRSYSWDKIRTKSGCACVIA